MKHLLVALPLLAAACAPISPTPPAGVSPELHQICQEEAQKAALRPETAIRIGIGKRVSAGTAIGVVRDATRGQDAYLACIRGGMTVDNTTPITLTDAEKAVWSTLSPAEQQEAAAHIRAGGTLGSYLRTRG